MKPISYKLLPSIVISAVCLSSVQLLHAEDAQSYENFPITVKDYQGDKTHSVAYNGQIARHLLHNAIKKMISESNGQENTALKAKLLQYFANKDGGRDILSPSAEEHFPIKQTKIDEISGKKNLADKTYKGAITSFPGNMTAAELLTLILEKASASDSGYDLTNGYDYAQLFSKITMGAVFYNQVVDNYLDEKLLADNKPNDQPYKEGAAYSGKEHVWDEAFGYFGAPAHSLSISPEEISMIAKAEKDALAKADKNQDGTVDLLTEMPYAYGSYAASTDNKSAGKTQYLHTIVQAFLDGRKLITEANSEKLTDSQRAALQDTAQIIKDNWELVIAENAYKYAGSVYEDLKKVQQAIDKNTEINEVYKKYLHHWSELKGFVIALHMGGKDLGETSVQLNRLIGYGPVLLGQEQVVDIKNGNFIKGKSIGFGEYMINMAKVQKVLAEKYEIKASLHEIADDIEKLSKKLGEKKSAEND